MNFILLIDFINLGLDFLSMIQIFLILSFLLNFQHLIKLLNLLFKLILVLRMICIKVNDLPLCFLNMSVKFNSLAFGILVVSIMIVNIILVIVNYRNFRVECQYRCFQSFNFNFLGRDGHLAMMKLFLNSNFLLVDLLVNGCGFCLFAWAGLQAGSGSFVTHGKFD